ncbi:MAG: hypothetical protein DLM59_14300 [Pseudonocardiales bacterium]|nr:MAG: hypothetical protein DLM59_14300 [Pseudonocardiales bacterium]
MPTPTSLVKVPSHDLATCLYCGGNRVTVLVMTLADGTPVEFASCHHCEGKRWTQGDQVLPLTSVLDRSRKQR